MVHFAHLNWCLPALLFWAVGSTHAQRGFIETVDHRRYDGSVRVGESNTLIISIGEQQHEIPLAQVAVARLNPPLFEPGNLPKGWRVEEVSGVRGEAGETNGTYTLRVTGGKTRDAKQQLAYYVYRVLRCDGEVVARVQSVDATNSCLAGVTLRDTLDPYSAMAFLGVTADRRLRFELREGGWQPIERRDEGVVKLPIWVKLIREQKEKEKDPFVSAYRSGNGENWEKIGQMKLPWRSEPVPEASDNWQPRYYAGIAITGPGTNTFSTAQLDHVAVTAHALLGEYFADSRFKQRRFSRADRKIDFTWGYGSPGADIGEDHFSVRWTGMVEPKFSENYRFYFDADNDAKLWVNGEELPEVAFKNEKKTYTGRELRLNAGQKYDVKLEFTEGAGAASVRLGWSSASQPLQTIRQLSYEYSANSPEEEESVVATNPAFGKGIWLRDGSQIVGEIVSSDDSATYVAWPGEKAPLLVPNTKIAHIVFRLSRRGLPLQVAENHTGIILKNGDFLEAEYLQLKNRLLVVNSLLFGRRAFSLDNNEALALVLNNYTPSPARFELRLQNRSVLRAIAIRPYNEQIIVTEPSIGNVAVPETEVIEIANTAPSVRKSNGASEVTSSQPSR